MFTIQLRSWTHQQYSSPRNGLAHALWYIGTWSGCPGRRPPQTSLTPYKHPQRGQRRLPNTGSARNQPSRNRPRSQHRSGRRRRRSSPAQPEDKMSRESKPRPRSRRRHRAHQAEQMRSLKRSQLRRGSRRCRCRS
ncbi:hypothetical protein L226DRAFT_172854 [Lentinus tigrinus ALCF2SS1-7]|uniref:uncharacterized protein n=1 Tax=Lentinus tigrinus ALCF2SS1-7 TaxID=1328758 RepID=UPI0011663EAF|nr:hypothetical protein L226DRAFT_172854 [Lentinus tigrinus ALCF2SS1-7]